MSVTRVIIKESSGKEYLLEEKNVVTNFGRDKRTCHVTFDPQASRVSRIHASIEWTDSGVVFTDKSKEGTVIEGIKLKQSSKEFDVGVYHISIGGIPVTIEVEGNELEETVLDSCEELEETQNVVEDSMQKVRETEEIAPKADLRKESEDEFDEISSISTVSFLKDKSHRKRKSDASLFEESQTRGRRGPRAQVNFDEEMENRGKKGPRARKAVERAIFDDETPAKKKKQSSQREQFRNYFRPQNTSTNTDDDVIETISSQVAAIPSVSAEPERKKTEILRDSIHYDRGPGAPNETIKYANLIFRQPELKRNETMSARSANVPNFKRFIPKNARDGRASAASMHSRTSCSTTISLIDARKIH